VETNKPISSNHPIHIRIFFYVHPICAGKLDVQSENKKGHHLWWPFLGLKVERYMLTLEAIKFY
jgi:hypothetical protein